MKAEELAMLCSALSIKERERPVGTLDSNLKAKGEHLLSLCLVGKVLHNKLVNKEALINVLSTIWRTNAGVEIEALEGNLFACYFKNLEDRKYVQSGGPWTFDRAIIAFEEPSGTGDIAHMKFNKAEFLVQIHNLPLLCLTEDIGKFLGKMIGEVYDVDLLTAKNVGGTFIRVRVAVSTDELLMRSLRVDLLGTGTVTTMLLRYERLQDYCFNCSKLGHSLIDCAEPGDKTAVITEAQLRLNVWLRSESPPKRFNHRNGPSGRRNWGYQGGQQHINASQDNWRSGPSWSKHDEGGSERQSGNRSWWKDTKLRSQIGIEPNKSIGKGETINASSGKSLTGVNSAAGKPSAAQGRKPSKTEGISINEGKERCNLMEVEPYVCQTRGIEVNNGPPASIQDTRPIEISEDQTIESQSVTKWKRVARGRKGDKGNPDLGENSKLRKRGLIVKEESGDSAAKKVKRSAKIGAEVQPSRESQEEINLGIGNLQDVEAGKEGKLSVREEVQGSWYNRNSFLFNGNKVDTKFTFGWSEKILSSFSRNSTKLPAAIDFPARSPPIWSPPNIGSFKINCIAIPDVRSRKTGIGVTIRNHNGCSVFSCCLLLNAGLHYLTTSSVAILKGLMVGNSLGLLPCSIESDIGFIVNLINSRSHSNFGGGNIICDIINILERVGISSVSLGKKGANKEVSKLARLTLSSGLDHAWKEGRPCRLPICSYPV
ncbi:hypothetical protein EZV62_008029 [Acer yangbiense]|uniref:CCHC-type domain-containing protein n=1 Tax=Acer yangbiense TaxID=1000413 RepID=A0A5C7IC62_9ROSI|nr:hypothetical protein EZV62_008029 [Acer yangbiense]